MQLFFFFSLSVVAHNVLRVMSYKNFTSDAWYILGLFSRSLILYRSYFPVLAFKQICTVNEFSPDLCLLNIWISAITMSRLLAFCFSPFSLRFQLKFFWLVLNNCTESTCSFAGVFNILGIISQFISSLASVQRRFLDLFYFNNPHGYTCGYIIDSCCVLTS